MSYHKLDSHQAKSKPEISLLFFCQAKIHHKAIGGNIFLIFIGDQNHFCNVIIQSHLEIPFQVCIPSFLKDLNFYDF